jgi:hypothetical protein
MPPDTSQKPRFVTGKDVIYACRNSWKKPYRDLLQQAYDAHCGLRLANHQHVIITSEAPAPAFNSTTISGRNDRGGSALAQYRRDTAKVIASQRRFEAEREGRPLPTKEPPVTGNSAPPDTTKKAVPTPPPTGQPGQLHCPACKPTDPGFLQLTDEALAEHLHKAHVQCPECFDWLRSRNGLGGHKSIKHGTAQPWRYRAVSKQPPPTDAEKNGAPVKRAAKKTTAPRRVKDTPVTDVPLPDPAPSIGATIPLPDALPVGARPGRDSAIVTEIRRLLGTDPQVAELTADRDRWKARAEDAETKLGMLDGLAAQIREAVTL